ncbi:MAG: 3-oxoacyl-[acyl-carrier-protein] reductase [Saprospiraceae bacterium]|nr:3-oxoacyl-[acyl-carrier-protein] reductase [Saprospiraceae bacterium]
MDRLAGKTCLVTGGSRGIGAAIVKRFVEKGATTYFTYRSSGTPAAALVESLHDEAGTAIAFASDATDFNDALKAVQKVVDESGTLDVLVNNAGITDDTLMLRMSEEQWDRVIEANLKSVFNLTKHALRPMLKNRKGSIINISSVVGVFGNAGQANYAASKAGILGFTKSIAKEVGSRNIRCNAIVPGYIETEMTQALDETVKEAFLQNIPLKRMGRSEEVAHTAAFLASDEASYVTGQVLSVCGGLNM